MSEVEFLILGFLATRSEVSSSISMPRFTNHEWQLAGYLEHMLCAVVCEQLQTRDYIIQGVVCTCCIRDMCVSENNYFLSE